MSTHPGIPVSGPEEYNQKVADLVGDRNPLEILAQTVSTLSDIVARHSATLLRRWPFEGKWTPNEVIGHLTDSEWVYGYRLRLILSEDAPAVFGTHQDLWVAALRHGEREPAELVEIFRTLRQLNLAVWRTTPPEDLHLICRHNERGPESLATMLRLLACHDLSHSDQINRYIEAIQRQD